MYTHNTLMINNFYYFFLFRFEVQASYRQVKLMPIPFRLYITLVRLAPCLLQRKSGIPQYSFVFQISLPWFTVLQSEFNIYYLIIVWTTLWVCCYQNIYVWLNIAYITPIRDKIAISCMWRQIHEFSSHAIRHELYIKNRERLFCP